MCKALYFCVFFFNAFIYIYINIYIYTLNKLLVGPLWLKELSFRGGWSPPFSLLATALPTADNNVDVISMSLLHILSNRQEYLHRFYRVSTSLRIEIVECPGGL